MKEILLGILGGIMGAIIVLQVHPQQRVVTVLQEKQDCDAKGGSLVPGGTFANPAKPYEFECWTPAHQI